MQVDNQIQYPPFHLAVPSNNLEKSKHFYGEILGCKQGRIDPDKWIDYNFFGNQLVAHYATKQYIPQTSMVGSIPVPNFGVHLTPEQYAETRERLSSWKIQYKVVEDNESGSEFVHVKDFTGNNLLLYCKK